ncbi:hypothetical protein [Parasphingorhabdus halotolerans]|uniref:Surface antigen n=1 Tax=Parasphingorhabdus halotolerans TaxID=2725558 RepID=A0A6H2DJ95_9SPHN|nr:hypothetical protein [Parasphingorhabdus halotolerans]QJB68460.1 hypothetical protein HF685_03390 [Parasphingorhabdus halotolerans]
MNRKLICCSVSLVGLFVTMPTFAAVGGSSNSQLTDDSKAVAGSQRASEATENIGTNTDSEATNPEGAASLSTLCGNGQGKADGAETKKRRGIFGMADRLSTMTRKIPIVGDFMVDSANSLSQFVACRLYPEEQKQATEATDEATRGAKIGKKVEWQSTIRENVSGSSTVTSKNKLANGTPCMILADIIIVDGEELKVSKTMCRLTGASRYTIMAA